MALISKLIADSKHDWIKATELPEQQGDADCVCGSDERSPL